MGVFADKHLTVCPLGLCTFEEICPKAPCINCMRALGEHLVAEVGIMAQQIEVARRQGNVTAQNDLHNTFASMRQAINRRAV